MTKDDGGPAFPWMYTEGHGGMSLRDWFAGMALQGMIASDPMVDRTKAIKSNWAEVAYKFADAMLKERNK